MRSKIFIGLLLAAIVPTARADRPSAVAVRVPDGSMQIDARAYDWGRLGESFERNKLTTDTKNWLVIDAERGGYHDKPDCSFTAHVAFDSDALYILADVRDDFSVHTWDDKEPWYGDDFEVFIQADAPANRYKEQTENCKQFVFVPAFVNPTFTSPAIWKKEEFAGVQVASRLRPFGYTIEIRIPRALFPGWVANPDLATIGFDLMTQDADAPGVDAHHPALKGAMFLQQIGQHFKTPELLSDLTFKDSDPPAAQMPVAVPMLAKPDVDATRVNIGAIGSAEQADQVAQDILDLIADERVAILAGAALDSPWIAVQRAGVQVLSMRPDLAAPAEKIAQLLAPRARDATPQPYCAAWLMEQSVQQYALLALARRGKLTITAFDQAMFAEDPQMLLTAVWCAGINGDKAFTLKLIPILKSPNMRIRMMAALALGELKDPTALEALQEIEANDPSGDPRLQAKLSIDKIRHQGLISP